MNIEEILSLHTKTEEEQWSIFCDEGICKEVVKYDTNQQPFHTWESLAECAFRLREKFDYKIKTIHWIQAALLAEAMKYQ